MRQITEITNSAAQRLTLVGENNEQIPFRIRYRPTQRAWYFDLEYNGTTIRNKKLVNSPNILNQWRNLFPFGIMCITLDDVDPFQVDDFQTGRARIFLLNEQEKLDITQNVIEAPL